MAIHISEILSWKYGHVADTADGKITAWRHPSIPQPDEVQLEADRQEYVAFLAANLYKEKRAKEYDPIGDQLDRITKCLSNLKEAGVAIGPEGEEQITRVELVKAKYPKPKE